MPNQEIIFPEVLDNSMRKELIKCQTAAHYRYEMGLESADAARVDLVAGKSFAAGLEATRKAFYVDGIDATRAIDIGIPAVIKSYGSFTPIKRDEPKSAQRMAGALAYYFNEYPLDKETLKPIKLQDGYAIEMQFLLDLPITHPTSGKPLKFAGRFDMLALDENKKAWVVDEKTTSQMGDKWSNQWFLDSQMTGYCHGARKILDDNGMQDTPVAGAYINGVAIRKNDYECRRLPVYREPWEMDRWYAQMVKDFTQWKDAFLAKDHSQALDHACAYYLNPCQFSPLCKSRNPERLIEGSFVIRRWDPVERKD